MMDSSYKDVYLHASKTKTFADKKVRSTEEELCESERYVLFKILKNNQTILDVGCASGGLYNIVKKRFENIKYTGIDIDALCIESARQQHPDATFVAGDIFENRFEDDSFEVVMSLMTMSMQPEYKKFIHEMVRIANKYVLFDARLKYDGPTIVDRDVSFFYYHGSGKRNYYVVHNVFELLNFLHIEALGLKRISVYGYYAPDKTSAFIPLPKNQLMAGLFCLEKHDRYERHNVTRVGGFKESAERPWCVVDIDLPGFQKEWF